jgi:methionyl-tRNA formyltransferase
VRTVFLGSSGFAVVVLSALATSPHTPVLVVTPPDRPRGRGRKTAPPPVARAARDLDIPVFQTESVNSAEALAAIDEAAPEGVAVCEFGQLIREPLLSHDLMLNVHPSLLPRWRGAAPIERALMAGDAVTGVTIIKLTEGLDSGPMAMQRAEPIHPDETRGSLATRLAVLGGELLIDSFDAAAAGVLELAEQPEEGVTYAEKIAPEERRLDPRRPAAELERMVRALNPGIGTFVELEGGERLGVEAARAVDEPLDTGAVRVTDSRLRLGCAEGALELVTVKPPGGRSMSAADYLRGHTPPARVAA